MALRPIDAVTHHVRVATRIAPGRPALWIGLRMAAVMTLPLALSPWLAPVTATAASLAGYLVTLVDKGGAYRTRARAMTLASTGALVAIVAGMMASGTVVAAPLVVVGFTACALAQHGGPAAVSVANVIAIVLAASSLRDWHGASLSEAMAGIALGAGWAMVLALMLWPVRVYRPGRQALCAVLDELAAHASVLADVALHQADRATLLARHRRVRERIEAARVTMVAMRRGRGERTRGERLVALVHVSDRVFGKLLALEELLDATDDREEAQHAARVLGMCASTLAKLATRVLDERRPAERLPAIDVTGPAGPALGALLAISAEQLVVIDQLIASLADDTEPAPAVAVLVADPERAPLRELFRLDSAVVRHALRVAICSTIAVVISSVIHLAYGYWMLLTVYLLLQPYRSATTTKTVQRGLGTIAGALLAAVVIAIVPHQGVLIVITVVFAALGASMLQLNFGLFSLFVTPTFVMLAELQTQDFTLAGLRVAYTLIGGAIAMFAITVLWPARERALLDDLLGDALDAAAAYLGAVGDALATRAPIPSLDVVRARRAFGLSLSNAEVALDRLITERAPDEVIEPRMTAIAAARRLGGSINVLASSRSLDGIAHDDTATRTRLAEAQLRALATAVRRREAPPPAPVTGSGLARVDAHVDGVRAALERCATGTSP